MQTLDVISLNLWQIIISLLNLAILYFLAKRFLFGPLENMLDKRKKEIAQKYTDAENDKRLAEDMRKKWEENMSLIKDEGETIIKSATEDAKRKSEKLIKEATKRAESIVALAKERAETERKNAENEIKAQIVDVSLVLAQKILMREVSQKDNSRLVDMFLEGLEDEC